MLGKNINHVVNGLRNAIKTMPSRRAKMSIKQMAAQYGYQRGLQVATNRFRDYYPGSSTDALRGDWTTQVVSSPNAISSDYKLLCARSESAYRTDSTYKRAMNVLATFIVGQGIKPFPDIKLLSTGENIKINETLERDWARFVEEGVRNGPVKTSIYQFQYLALLTMAVYGNALINRVKSKNSSYLPYAFQMIKPTRLDFTKDTYFGNYQDTLQKKNILHGMELNEFGEPIKFYFENIPAPYSSDQMFLSFIPTETEQYLGSPWGSAVLPDVWDVQQLFADKLTQSRIGAKLGYYMHKSDQPDFEVLESSTNDGQDSYVPLDFQGFVFGQGEPKAISLDDAIAETFDPLVRMTVSKIASGLGFSYQLLSSDLKGMNFASSRANIIADNKTFRTLFNSFVSVVCKPMWDSFVEWEVLTGKIPGLPYSRFISDKWYYTQCYWLPLDGEDWVDPLKDAQALELLYKMGQITFQELCNRTGKDYMTVLKQRKKERELFAQYDPSLLVTDKSNNGGQKTNSEETENADEQKDMV